MEQENLIVSSIWILLGASLETLSRAVADDSIPAVLLHCHQHDLCSETQVQWWKKSTNTKKEAKVDMNHRETIKSK